MTSTLSRPTTTHLPAAGWLTAGLLIFLGLTATAGGWMLVTGFGSDSLLPNEWLLEIPLINSWVVPGIVLGVGFGLGSLLVAYGLVKRPPWNILVPVAPVTGFHWSWLATIVVGASHVVWITLELVLLPEATWLQAIYGPLGLALAGLPWLRSMRVWLAIRL